MRTLNAAVQQQAATLSTIDTYIAFAMIAVGLLVLAVTLPERTLPPRLALAGQG